jgi:hypothetical protein
MKPTALLLTVILFVGVSCITKDKTEIILKDDKMLSEISVKEENVAPLPQPFYKQETKSKAVRYDVVED